MTLNLHTYQQHPRHNVRTMHLHEREVHIIAEAVAQQGIDAICFQEVGEYRHDPIAQPYGEVPSNMAFRICRRLREWGHWFHIHQDWSHIGFQRWREGTAILSGIRYDTIIPLTSRTIAVKTTTCRATSPSVASTCPASACCTSPTCI
ncbi:hypothetical protein [Methylomonas koyamae]|uniref:hypothetical protein n=1 Tax=Methylomonas koyamae TaxID=702114 RepID=UPI00210FF186|nr:hypothetical protein [Methylomonas koyamae]